MNRRAIDGFFDLVKRESWSWHIGHLRIHPFNYIKYLVAVALICFRTRLFLLQMRTRGEARKDLLKVVEMVDRIERSIVYS